MVDQLNLSDADLIVHARSIFLDGRGGSHRTANGCCLLSNYGSFSGRSPSEAQRQD
jgi:hypothetical protein